VLEILTNITGVGLIGTTHSIHIINNLVVGVANVAQGIDHTTKDHIGIQ